MNTLLNETRPVTCKICEAVSDEFGKAKVLNKHWVQYFRCRDCGYVFTQKPYWLDEAYSEAINTSDLGLVGRNLKVSYILPFLIRMFFDSNAPFVDFGGGYGLLVRIMRDRGFDFYRYDEYCANLFAKGFDIGDAPKKTFELLTAIEVFEHLVDPVREVGEMVKLSRNIFFTTEVLPPKKTPDVGEWSYYGLEHGQHVGIFTETSLKKLGEHFGLYYVTNHQGIHLLTEKKISNFAFSIAASSQIGKVMMPLMRRTSLLSNDYYKVTGNVL